MGALELQEYKFRLDSNYVVIEMKKIVKDQ